MTKTLDDLNEWAAALRKEGHPLADTMEEIAEGWREDIDYLKRRAGMSDYKSKPWSIEDELLVGQFSEADARLVADGSDLLEALSLCVTAMKKGTVDLYPHEEVAKYALERATELIEKHKGEQE